MKKIVSSFAMALALCGLVLTGCASTGSAKNDSAANGAATASVHPRTYHIDLADAEDGSSVAIVYNQYGPNYQSSPNLQFGKYVKTDKPKAGDTVILHYKGTVDKDIPVLLLGLVDDSAAANYWTNLLDSCVVIAENLKAGDTFEGECTFTLIADVKQKFGAYIQYDSDDTKKLGYPLVETDCVLKFEKCGETTDTSKELPADAPAAPVGPQTYNVDLADIAKMLTIGVNASDGQIWNYQYIGSITDAFNIDYLPQAGDTINIKFTGTSDITIEGPVYMTLVENTAAVGWWKDLISDDVSKFHVFAEGITAGEEFTGEATFTLMNSCVEGISIQMYYDPYEGASGATWIYKR
ncbi:MAG: hypothetical protein MJ188_07490 [Treponema sp.]|nr:hypothetical protein [Treponema sp.]